MQLIQEIAGLLVLLAFPLLFAAAIITFLVRGFRQGWKAAWEAPVPRHAKKVIMGTIAGVILLVFATDFYNNKLSPKTQEQRRLIEQMQPEQVSEIILMPDGGRMSLSDHAVSIRDREQIAEIISLLRTAHPYRTATQRTPRPATRPERGGWEARLVLKVADREVAGPLTSSEYYGTAFCWAYLTYRQDALGSLMEKLVKQEATR